MTVDAFFLLWFMFLTSDNDMVKNALHRLGAGLEAEKQS
jgi:hypothetical protein